MLRFLLPATLSVLLSAATAWATATASEDQTVYWHSEKAWAVGTVGLGKPMTFRDGRILVFPAQVTDLVWSPGQGKPRNMMLVHEVFADDGDKRFFAPGESFFAPVRLLPENSYWRDNLPNTPRHEIGGGRRNVFRGKDAEDARRVLGAYMKAHETKGLGRWKEQLAAVASGLATSSSVLREDSARFLARYQSLARDLPVEAVPSIEAFLASEAPVEQKAPLIDALATARIEPVRPVLARLASRADATGAAALHGQELFGEAFETQRLVDLSRSGSVEIRAWAVRMLGSRAANDEAARSRAVEQLASGSDEAASVRSAAAVGLAAGGLAAPLVDAVARGDESSRPAATAIAERNLVAAAGPLIEILEKAKGEAAFSAVAALARLSPCKECRAALHRQLEANSDEAVRDLIGVVLGVPVKHEH